MAFSMTTEHVCQSDQHYQVQVDQFAKRLPRHRLVLVAFRRPQWGDDPGDSADRPKDPSKTKTRIIWQQRHLTWRFNISQIELPDAGYR